MGFYSPLKHAMPCESIKTRSRTAAAVGLLALVLLTIAVIGVNPTLGLNLDNTVVWILNGCGLATGLIATLIIDPNNFKTSKVLFLFTLVVLFFVAMPSNVTTVTDSAGTDHYKFFGHDLNSMHKDLGITGAVSTGLAGFFRFCPGLNNSIVRGNECWKISRVPDPDSDAYKLFDIHDEFDGTTYGSKANMKKWLDDIINDRELREKVERHSKKEFERLISAGLSIARDLYGRDGGYLIKKIFSNWPYPKVRRR